ncbi:hypothetical protein [Deinococcus sp.]|uniref:hypothetical protein n=1 Tax=Deinococcus sp. TaxID=47478 RepID=UPI003B5A39C7
MKNLLKPATALALTLALTACNSTPKPPPITPEEPIGTVTGQITADKISGMVSDKLLFGGTVDLIQAASRPGYIASLVGTVDKLGKLTLPLEEPPYAPLEVAIPPYGSDCDFTGTASNPAGQIVAYGAMLGYDKNDDPVATIQEKLTQGATTSDALVVRVYADTDQVLNGVVECYFRNYKLRYDLNLKAGWNVAEASGDNSNLIIKTLSKNARSTLNVTRLDAGVGVSLDDYSLKIKPGERLIRKASVYPIGGYSGAVKLSTDVPGLSVEPGSVTIAPPVTAQNVNPQGWAATGPLRALSADLSIQSVETTLTFVAAADAPDFNGTGELRVTGSDGKIVGREALAVGLIQPTFNISINSPDDRYTIYGNEQMELPVNLPSLNGFTDPIVVTLENAPSGIAAIPTTGQANEGVSLTLTVGAGVPAGDYDLTISGTSGLQVRRQTLKVRIQSKRSAIGTTPLTSLTLAPNGDLWGTQGQRLTQIRGEKIINTFNLPENVNLQRVQTGPDGSVWARATSGKLYRVSGGALQEIAAVGLTNYYEIPPFGIDKQGRVWLMMFDGFNTPTLNRIDPVTKENKVMATVKSANAPVPVVSDVTGSVVLFPAADGSLVKVDTSTGVSIATKQPIAKSTDQNNYQSITFITLDRNNKIWLTVASNQGEDSMKKVDISTMNVVKTVVLREQAFSTYNIPKIIVEDDQTAWLANGFFLYQLNLNDGSQKQLQVGYHPDGVSAISLAPQAGIAYSFGPQYITSPEQQYLRFQR